ncbi:MAG TPA: hypothetical protein VMV26_14110 [Alphaproteobacteria bacterium]|nr:hypothetical protein [Alphaproteobacteria bacterium]
MASRYVDKFKSDLAKAGFSSKAILDEKQLARLVSELEKDPLVSSTPDTELRYIEGLLRLPLEFIEFFSVIPKSGCEKCKCGREPSALEVISYAIKH